MTKKNADTVKVITLIILLYIFFLDTSMSNKIKALIALLVLTLLAFVSYSVYIFVVPVAFVTLIYNSYTKFNFDINGITNKILAWTFSKKQQSEHAQKEPLNENQLKTGSKLMTDNEGNIKSYKRGVGSIYAPHRR